MTDHGAEMDAILAMLSEACLVEEYVNEDGKPAMRLTPDGAQVARQMAMSDDPDGVLQALLEAQHSWT
jgi:hypothetical protein